MSAHPNEYTILILFIQKGFGEETSTLQTELEEYFNKFGRVNAVRMRRDQDKKFKVQVNVIRHGQHTDLCVGLSFRRVL